MFGFPTGPQKLVIKFLKKQFSKQWREKWDLLSPVWDSIMAKLRDNMALEVAAFFESRYLWKNAKDAFAGTEKNPKWYDGYSIPLAYLRSVIEKGAFQRNLSLDEFKAVNLEPDVVRQITSLLLNLYFLKTLQGLKGQKIGNSEYLLLDIMEEAYRVDSDNPSFNMMLKTGSVGSGNQREEEKKLVKAWTTRNKATPARYKPGSFYASKLSAK